MIDPDNGAEWNVLITQCSMQEFGDGDPQSLSSSVLTHSLSLTGFPMSEDLEIPEDSKLAEVREMPMPALVKTAPIPPSELLPCLSLNEVKVLNWVATHPFYLHLMVFRREVQMLRQFLAMEPGGLAKIVNEKDHRGNTPLMLAVKLSHLSACYYTISRVLLGRGADPRKKDAHGWSPLDEAVAKGDRDLVGLLFDHLYREKTKVWETAKRKAIAALRQLPDFYVELKWEFDSAVIPLVSKLAPHDICKIWKSGSSLRLDMTLVGWKKLRSKRRNVSLLFLPGSDLSYRDFILVNHSKRLIVYPLEPLDSLEREAVVSDVLRSEAVKGEVSVSQCTVAPVNNWSGKQTIGKVGKWRCSKLEVQMQAIVNYTKKDSDFHHIRESEYFSNVVGQATRPSSVPSSPELEPRTQSEVASGEPSKADDQIQSTRKGRLLMWVTRDFPMTLSSFLPVLEMLAPGNSTIQKMYELMTSEAFARHFSADMFPVKLEVPLTMTIKAQATFLKMEIGPIEEDVLIVPDYANESRRVAQKTLTCPKKRIVFANIAV